MPVRMRMRWTAYAGASTALAAGVILKALAQRPNFYSAAVYLSQSSANLMILTNLLFVVACTILLGLQKLLYGNLRAIEIEQLYEKAWFAVTETCLAMTVFRGELGLPFLAMFFALLTGKVWGWIGEGRVEVLEQQPPRNPRLFHTRLALSLGLSVAFDLTMLEYVVKQVMRMARPDMMVMFGFEFAVLSIMSMSTALRYAVDLLEIGIVREQKRQRIEQIKIERVDAAVTEFQASQAQQATPTDASETTPTPTLRTLEQVRQEAFNQPVDENEVEVEGWEDKGRYMFYLNLATDFFKLVIYLAFFFILLVFYGLPIHILRDVFLTMRSFLKRISDFMKYRAATRDMNARYPDATAEDIGREDVCIICREDMQPYQPPAAQDGQRPNPVAERMRPKKLPCGHILHFSCLRSWLERQQICPTCRANVVRPTQGSAAAGQAGAVQGDARQPQPNRRQGPRVYQFGPLRIGVGAARGNDMFEDLQQQLADAGAIPRPPANANGNANANADPNGPRQFGVGFRWSAPRRRQPGESHRSTQTRIDALEQQIQREAEQLARNSAELSVLQSMQAELQRLRATRGTPIQSSNAAQGMVPGAASATPAQTMSPLTNTQIGARLATRFEAGGQQDIIQAGSDRLPPGLTLPEGWSMTPLHPMGGIAAIQAPPGPNNAGLAGLPAIPLQFPGPIPDPAPMLGGQFPPMNFPGFGFPPGFAPRPPPNMAGHGQAGTPHPHGTQVQPQAPGSHPAQHQTWPAFPPQFANRFGANPSGNQQRPQAQQNGTLQHPPTEAPAQPPPVMGFPPFENMQGLDFEFANIAAELAQQAQQQPQANGHRPGGGASTSDVDGADAAGTSAVNGHQQVPVSPPSRPIPSCGFDTANDNEGSNSSDAAQVNGSHDEESNTAAPSSSSSSQPGEGKNRQATVEDLVEDPD
ncbi:E3 ubiquitin-protein ligase hrd1 [Exophiala xenobiotica]|nr:E3 ubiquitin-protein ligase hrd1 [Exophiala xenobiotica]